MIFSIQCDHCENPHMHLYDVEVYMRVREDDETGLHARIDRTGVEADSLLDENPSERRSGLVVNLECESCGKFTALKLSEHEGIFEMESLHIKEL